MDPSNRDGCVVRHPCIVTGDFNFQPHSPIYQFLAEGGIDHYGLYSRGPPDELLLPQALGISPQCQVSNFASLGLAY